MIVLSSYGLNRFSKLNRFTATLYAYLDSSQMSTKKNTFSIYIKQTRYYKIDIDEADYMESFSNYFNDIPTDRWYNKVVSVFKRLCKRKNKMWIEWTSRHDESDLTDAERDEWITDYILPHITEKYKILGRVEEEAQEQANQTNLLAELSSDEE